MSDMRRREFTALVGGVGLLLAVKVRRARAQQATKLPTIGFLGATTPAGGGQLSSLLWSEAAVCCSRPR